MTFRIFGLDAAPFRHLFGLSDAGLAAHGARRVIADAKPGFPDRIELSDAEVGESLLLLNYEHQPARTAYRSRHAIFIREGAESRFVGTDVVPQSLRSRIISLRAFDESGEMVDADLIAGQDLASLIARFLANPNVAYLHAHYAKQGCYAARIDRDESGKPAALRPAPDQGAV